jgi:P2-related tail formation protein
MFQEIDDYASDDTEGQIGWSILVDVDRAPAKALPWLAQFVGVSLDQSLSEAAQRNQIKETAGFNRGTPAAIIDATQRHLTGTKDVIMIERYQGSAYKLYVATRTAQTPNPTITQADVVSQKPAGIVLTYQTLTGQTYNELLADSALYSNVFSNYLTYQGVLIGTHGV